EGRSAAQRNATACIDVVLAGGVAGVAARPASRAAGIERRAACRGAGQAAAVYIDRRGAGLEGGAAVKRQRSTIQVEIFPGVKGGIGTRIHRKSATIQAETDVGTKGSRTAA